MQGMHQGRKNPQGMGRKKCTWVFQKFLRSRRLWLRVWGSDKHSWRRKRSSHPETHHNPVIQSQSMKDWKSLAQELEKN